MVWTCFKKRWRCMGKKVCNFGGWGSLIKR